MTQRVADDLAGWAAGLRWNDLPAEVRHHVRLMWGDTFGCLMLGADHEETLALSRVLYEARPEGRTASAVGGAARLMPLDAIMVNGLATGVHFLDGGNIASRGHVSGYVLPAVLTAAEQLGASFEKALTAFLIGYEVSARIGYACKLPAAMHPSATWSVIGAAAALGYLHELGAEDLARLLELAANLTIATSWDAAIHGATVRDVYHPMSSYLGTLAHDLFRAGIRGGPRAIEMTFGGVSAPEFDAARCIDKLGDRFMIEYDYLKRYPCCRNFHATLDALFDAMPALPHPFDAEHDSVAVGADLFAYRDNREVHTESVLAVRESLPVSVAKALLAGKLTPEMYAANVYAPADVIELARRIRIEEAPRPSDDARTGWIEIRQGGHVIRREVTHPAGNPARPLGEEEIRAKFLRNAATLLGSDAAQLAAVMFEGDLAITLDSALPHWLGAGSLRLLTVRG